VMGDSAGGLAARQRTSVTSLVGGKGTLSSADLQQLVSTLLEIKVDLKNEITKVNNRVDKISQHVEQVSTKLLSAQELFISEMKEKELEKAAAEAAAKAKKRESRSQDKSPRHRISSGSKTKTASTSGSSSRVPSVQPPPEAGESKKTDSDTKPSVKKKDSEGGTDEDQDLTSKL